MEVQPKSMYKLIRALNHWIDNLINFYNGDDITTSDNWYKRWNSSNRTIQDTYQVLTGKINDENITCFLLVMHLIEWIPQLRPHYDIRYPKSTDSNQKVDHNYFTFELKLYYGDTSDTNNPFNAARSMKTDYIPFDENRSLMSWYTRVSSALTSSKQNSGQDIPSEVNIASTNRGNSNEETGPNLLNILNGIDNEEYQAGDNDLSLSPNELSKTALQPNTMDKRTTKNNNQSEGLRQLVSATCKSEIQR